MAGQRFKFCNQKERILSVNENNLNFEAALVRLEEITRVLESGSVSLDDSLKLFEEGVGLVRFCNEKLENAKLKVLKVNTSEGE
ncbi:MAG: exodeoxyribonuclease VII small subunit [Ruminococcaceae bacterium]|nr:exodeoxyribonuclease VII small subunit [Oscillospiraceae bacterium]